MLSALYVTSLLIPTTTLTGKYYASPILKWENLDIKRISNHAQSHTTSMTILVSYRKLNITKIPSPEWKQK